MSCKRAQDPRAVFGKRLPGLPVDGTSPSRRSLTFQLEPNMKIIKALMDIAAMPAGFQGRGWLFSSRCPHTNLHTPTRHGERGTPEMVQALVMGRQGEKCSKIPVFVRPVPQVLQVSLHC